MWTILFTKDETSGSEENSWNTDFDQVPWCYCGQYGLPLRPQNQVPDFSFETNEFSPKNCNSCDTKGKCDLQTYMSIMLNNHLSQSIHNEKLTKGKLIVSTNTSLVICNFHNKTIHIFRWNSVCLTLDNTKRGIYALYHLTCI